jgi:hypothetical protein
MPSGGALACYKPLLADADGRCTHLQSLSDNPLSGTCNNYSPNSGDHPDKSRHKRSVRHHWLGSHGNGAGADVGGPCCPVPRGGQLNALSNDASGASASKKLANVRERRCLEPRSQGRQQLSATVRFPHALYHLSRTKRVAYDAWWALFARSV